MVLMDFGKQLSQTSVAPQSPVIIKPRLRLIPGGLLDDKEKHRAELLALLREAQDPNFAEERAASLLLAMCRQYHKSRWKVVVRDAALVVVSVLLTICFMK